MVHKQGVGDFPYYVGINSLEELATKDDRVVVLNILGKESSGVTPVSNDYSGGNIVLAQVQVSLGNLWLPKMAKFQFITQSKKVWPRVTNLIPW